jgi:cytochrome c oxidase subunit 3
LKTWEKAFVANHEAVAHHFVDKEQQNETLTLGMWLFLATEVMFFGGLFCAYVVYRAAYPEIFDQASRTLSILHGGVNTFVLLCSSFTVALSVRAAQLGRNKQLALLLAITIILGGIFLGIKGIEYADKFHHHHMPGVDFRWDGETPGPAQLFFVLYFIMTGVHAVHMVIGLGLFAILLVMALMKKFGPDRYMGVELIGLYWHFVDIIWVFLFPLLYLIDRT